MGYNKDIVIHICGKGTHFCFFFQTFLSFSFHKVQKNVCTYRYLAKFHEKHASSHHLAELLSPRAEDAEPQRFNLSNRCNLRFFILTQSRRVMSELFV